jgi:hypothetical protein
MPDKPVDAQVTYPPTGLSNPSYQKGQPPQLPKEPVISQEEYFTPNAGPEPVVINPQVMIVGDTGGYDPHNSHVYHGPRQDYVMVEDWRWNEDALKKGADIIIPDAAQNDSIQELRVVQAMPDPTPASTMTSSQANAKIQEKEDAANNNTPASASVNTEEVLGGNQATPLATPPVTPPATSAQTPSAPSAPAPTQAQTDGVEIPGSQEPPALFKSFLREKGEFYSELRKNLRSLGLPSRSQYEQAYRLLQPDEKIGYDPQLGWIAFRIKTWRDLSPSNIKKWMATDAYAKFATAAAESPASLDSPPPVPVSKVTRLQAAQPNEYKVNISDDSTTPSAGTNGN